MENPVCLRDVGTPAGRRSAPSLSFRDAHTPVLPSGYLGAILGITAHHKVGWAGPRDAERPFWRDLSTPHQAPVLPPFLA